MILIEWKEDFSVHIAEIDRQHQTLIDIINELYSAMLSRQTKQTLSAIIDKTYNYAKSHFAFEEEYFGLYGFPESQAHKAIHRELMEKIEDYKVQFEAGRLMLSIEIMQFLKEWLENHMLREDKKYSTFLNERGVH